MATTIQNYNEIKNQRDKAFFKLKMIEQYLGYIRKHFDQNTVFTHLEEKGVHHEIKWSVHKLLHHDLDNKDFIEFVTQCMDEKLLSEIEEVISLTPNPKQ